MEGCRFSPDRENGILNAYLRCYRWRSQRQRILYKAFWKASLIFHQNCVYTRKQTKKEVCCLNPPRSLSLTHTHICSVLYFWSPFTHSFFFHFTVSPTSPIPTLHFCSLTFHHHRFSDCLCKFIKLCFGILFLMDPFCFLCGVVYFTVFKFYKASGQSINRYSIRSSTSILFYYYCFSLKFFDQCFYFNNRPNDDV